MSYAEVRRSIAPEEIRKHKLLEAIPTIPSGINLVPCYNRTPIRPGWKEEQLSRLEVYQLIESGEWIQREDESRYFQNYNGYAMRTGGGLVVIDMDGKSAVREASRLFGTEPSKTPAWKGSKGKSLLYRLPSELTARIAALPRSIRKLRVADNCAKGEAIELLYDGATATLPPSWHPNTDDGYQWIWDWSNAIATAPEWICDRFAAECDRLEYLATLPIAAIDESTCGASELAEILGKIDPDCEYESWIGVGYALKKLSPDDGLDLWEGWSQQSSKYRQGDCEKRWGGLENPRIGLNFLKRLAGLPTFSGIPGGKDGQPQDDSPAAVRDRMIARRLWQFRQLLPTLQSDFSITPNPLAGRDICPYEGHTPDFSFALLDKEVKNIFVRGFLAAGKTHAAIESLALLFQTLKKVRSQQIVWISSRNGLLRQTEGRMLERLKSLGVPIYFFQDDVGLNQRQFRTGQPGIYIFTDAGFSDYHVGRVDWSNVTVIVDEFSSVRREVISKTNVITEFKRMMATCGTLVTMDAFLGDIDVSIVNHFRQTNDRQYLIYDQVKQKAPKRIRVVECRNKDGSISLSHDGVALSILDGWFRFLKDGNRYIVVTDSLMTAKILFSYVVEMGYLSQEQILLICSETIEENHIAMPNPDRRIAERDIVLVIATPTAESGLDIQTPFTQGLALFCGVLPAPNNLQMIGRARQCDDWIVSAPRRSINTNAPAFNDHTIASTINNLAGALDICGMENDDRSHQWAVWQRKVSEVYRHFNAEATVHLLEEHYGTVDVEFFEVRQTDWRNLMPEYNRGNAIQTIEADGVTGEEFISAEKAPATDADVWNIRKAQRMRKFPKSWETITTAYEKGKETEDEELVENAIATAIGMLRDRELNVIDRYVRVTDCNEGMDNRLDDRVARRGCNYSSEDFKEKQYQTFFRRLQCGKLAEMRKGDKPSSANADKTCWNQRSRKMRRLHKKFQENKDLAALFPDITNVTEFTYTLRKVMTFYGYVPSSGTARVKREDGEGGTTNNPEYFVGWISWEEGRSKFFRIEGMIEYITEEIREEHKRLVLRWEASKAKANSHDKDDG
ncbi:MAG: PriCT-2 domain-containing protein [Microcoleus sp.]